MIIAIIILYFCICFFIFILTVLFIIIVVHIYIYIYIYNIYIYLFILCVCVCLCIKSPVWCFIPMLPSSTREIPPLVIRGDTWCFSSQALNELRSEGIPCVFTFGGEVQEPQAPPMPQSPGYGLGPWPWAMAQGAFWDDPMVVTQW